MSKTTKIPQDHLAQYFDAFTKRFLRDGSPEAVDVELLAPELGDQFAAQGARLLGITFDTNKNALELELDAGDHRVYHPQEVWVLEEPDGFVSALQVARADGSREVVSVKRVGLGPVRQDTRERGVALALRSESSGVTADADPLSQST